MSNYLIHYGVKGMKWGVRKYRPTSIRGAISKIQNRKVDKSFKKWKEGAANRDDAIAKGKEMNQAKLAYELNGTPENKKAYKQAKDVYKKAYKKNTTYRKGTVRQKVGQDLSRKYMSAAKKASDQKTANRFMNKHDIERAKARRAQQVGSNRSQYKAGLKRSATMTIRAAATAGVVAAGVYLVDRYTDIDISTDKAKWVIDKGEQIIRSAWKYI